MKLYIEDGEVLLDYSDVDFDDATSQAAVDYRDFMCSCTCGWEKTLKPKVKKMSFTPDACFTPYGNASRLRSFLGNCYYTAIYYKTIEISEGVKDFLEKLDVKRKELQEIEQVKERELQAAQEWKNKCKFGCGRCLNKVRSGDDFMCRASGDILEERNVPKNYGATHYLFNYEAYPSENCPYNVNKQKEAV